MKKYNFVRGIAVLLVSFALGGMVGISAGAGDRGGECALRQMRRADGGDH